MRLTEMPLFLFVTSLLLRATFMLGFIYGVPVQAGTDSWNFEAGTYIWLPESTAEIETAQGDIESTLSVSDALDQLDVGFMVTLLAERNAWTIVTDLVYLNLTAEESTPLGFLYREIEAETTLAFLSGYGFYKVLSTDAGALGIGLGARYVESSIDVAFTGGLLPDTATSIDDDWLDPVVSARFVSHFSENWIASVVLDAGGMGSGDASDSTWQTVIMLGYELSDKFLVRGGYRHLYMDRESDGQHYQFEMTGLLGGISYRF